MEFESVNYIKNPLSVDELKELLRRAELTPEDVMRTKEPAYREHVAGKSLSDDEMLRAIAAHPELLQRPIVVRGNKAVLARPVGNLAKVGITWAIGEACVPNGTGDSGMSLEFNWITPRATGNLTLGTPTPRSPESSRRSTARLQSHWLASSSSVPGRPSLSLRQDCPGSKLLQL